MTIPAYDSTHNLTFGGSKQQPREYDTADAAILPIPLDRTTSYMPGTRLGPREILLASSQMELWDDETATSATALAMYTLPEMELPFASMRECVDEMRRVAAEVLAADKFLVSLGGEHSVTVPLVEAAAARYPGLAVLQIDAHADMRESYHGDPFSHASAMRRAVEHCRCTQVAIRSLSEDEAMAIPSLATTVFYDAHMRKDPQWMDAVVASLGDPVYVTIDVDGFDPAIMPATGTPEPGGLGWREGLALLRKVFEARRVVAADVVELAPIPGLVAPNFLCARLVYKLLTYWKLSSRK
ncbi:MAG: agmatinase [Bacteroidales bacterium]